VKNARITKNMAIKCSFTPWVLLTVIFAANVPCLRASDLEYETAALYGNSESMAYYYTTLMVGTPPQKQTVIVDTGSSILNFSCSTCQDDECGSHMDKHFEIGKSSSFENLTCSDVPQCPKCSHSQCIYQVHYSEGSSIYGTYVRDMIDFDTNAQWNDGVDYEFVCNSKETKLIKSQEADGIMGLNSASQIIPKAYEQNPNIDHNIFSLCIGHKGGYFNIGAGGPEEELTDVQWTEYQGSKQYEVNLEAVTIAGETHQLSSSDFNNHKPFIDSGTTDVYLAKPVYDIVSEAFHEYCKGETKCLGKKSQRNQTDCWLKPEEISEEVFYDSFPLLEFTFTDVKHEWHPREYLSGFSGGSKSLRCLSIQVYGKTILGGTFMKNHNVIFDRTAKKIGFQKKECLAPVSDADHDSMIEEILARHGPPIKPGEDSRDKDQDENAGTGNNSGEEETVKEDVEENQQEEERQQQNQEEEEEEKKTEDEEEEEKRTEQDEKSTEEQQQGQEEEEKKTEEQHQIQEEEEEKKAEEEQHEEENKNVETPEEIKVKAPSSNGTTTVLFVIGAVAVLAIASAIYACRDKCWRTDGRPNRGAFELQDRIEDSMSQEEDLGHPSFQFSQGRI